MNYFIQIDDQPPLGPLTADHIKRRIIAGRSKASDLVRRESEEEWKPLGKLQEFQFDKDGQLKRVPNHMAVASVVLGCASVPLLFLCNILQGPYFLLASLAAIVFGHLARWLIKRNPLQVGGGQSAKAGLWIGYGWPIILILISVFNPPGSRIPPKSNQTKAINNCKQIITTLKLYSGDNGGEYPDFALPNAHTSNEVFRELFKAGDADSEAIFGCPNSSDGNPDGNIGKVPDYAEALKPNENHWAMTKGLTDSDPGNIPLVYESPADATWPPKWNPSLAGTTKPGRTWSGGKVIIGFNDGSVVAMPLESTKGQHVGLRPHPDGTPIFPTFPGRKLQVLDVAR